MKKLKFVLRGFRNNSRLNLLNIFSMSVGIAAAIIIFSYVYQEFNYDSQWENSSRIYHVLFENDRNEMSGAATYGPLAQDLKNGFPEIEDGIRMSFYYGYLAFTAGDNMFNEDKAVFADPNFFTLFSIPLEKGDPGKCLDSPNSVVISKSAAQKYFGKNEAIGSQLKIGNDKLFTVTGVYNDFLDNSNFNTDIILPLEIISKLTQVWIEPSYNYATDIHTFILAENYSDKKSITSKISDFLSAHVEENKEKLVLQPLSNIHTEKQIGWESVPQANKSYLFLLALVAFVILAISSINFLLLHIGTASRKAISSGVKKVCGASKAALFRDHLYEVLFYFAVSVIISLIIFFIYNSVLASRISFLPDIINIDLSFVVILSAIILVLAVLASVMPAIVMSVQKPISIFKSDKQLPKQAHGVNYLVIGQFTISVILLAITILFYKQVHFLEKFNPGFAKEELIIIPLNMHIGDGIYNENMDVFCDELKKQSGVVNVTFAFSSPSDVQTSVEKVRCEGLPEGKAIDMQWNSVYFDYFETLGLDIVEGRGFSHDFPSDKIDYDSDRKCGYVINQKAADELGIENPVGKTLYSFREGIIVGIVEDFNFKSLHSEIAPMSFDLNPLFYNEIIVRINPQAHGVLADIESVWKQFASGYPFEFRFVDDQVNKMYESESRLTASLNLFSGIAILIACMGLLALTILATQKRTKEIGIRKVNGAKIYEILTMLNKDFVKWVVIAFVIATPLAYFAMNKWLDNFAYKTSISWWIFVLAGILALGIALLTVSFQSWKAARRNPVEALRYE